MLCKELQSLNADSPILVTPSGIIIFVNELHPENVLTPILVNVEGSVASVNALQGREDDTLSG